MSLVIGGPVFICVIFFAVMVSLPHPLNHSQKSHLPFSTKVMFGTGQVGSKGLYLRFQVADCANFCCSFVESLSSFSIAYTAPVMFPVSFGLVVCLLATEICEKLPVEKREIFWLVDSDSFSFGNKPVVFVSWLLCWVVGYVGVFARVFFFIRFAISGWLGGFEKRGDFLPNPSDLVQVSVLIVFSSQTFGYD